MKNPVDNPVIALLSSRRSVKPDRLLAPGPQPPELETMLRIASRVPDHKKLAPWRFIVLEGDARAKLGDVIADACIAEEPERPSSGSRSCRREPPASTCAWPPTRWATAPRG
jgi:nitroreductase